MGVADSPLRDRVIFVVGAPRSGTTLLAALLSAHPEIAGITGESRVFEQGVGGLFANHEAGAHLDTYVSRAQLVDVVRGLVDGVLEQMRAATRPGARYALEKTPAVARDPEVPLRRKLECYPDAWYLHVLRDREEAVNSLLRAAFNPDQSRRASEQWVDDGVRAISDVLGAAGRYREVRYDGLATDPRATVAGLYAWLGLDADEGVLDRVELLSRERYAAHRPRHGGLAEGRGGEGSAPKPDGRRRGRGARRPASGRGSRRLVAFGESFARAFREGDAATLAELTAPEVQVILRSADGDLDATGDDGRRALLEIGRVGFAGSFLSESWAVSPGEGVSALFSGVRHDGTRVDLWCTVIVRRGHATRVAVLSAGPLSGRPLRAWSPGLGEPSS